MARVMQVMPAPHCTLEDCVAAMAGTGFAPHDEESLQHGADWLARLGRNKSFLGDMMLDELTNRHGKDDPRSAYGPQVIMLSRPEEGFFMRANIWPSAQEHSFRASGGGSFVYGLPHDHNFDFLTVGYFGPGYESDYYEYDFEAVQGGKGEKANLRFIERSTLSEGKVMHYRAHRDVHRQLPPKSLSVSLNILRSDPAQGWFDQYRFDIEKDEIADVISHGSGEVFLRCAVGMGGEEALSLAECFGKHHPSDRMRLAAWEARASLCGDAVERDALWRDAEHSGSRMVAMEAKRRRDELASA